MSRAPSLTSTVITAIEALLADMAPATYVGTDKEPAVKYLTLLAQHYWSPEATKARQKAAELVSRHRGR